MLGGDHESQASISSTPPPTATPFTAAIKGLLHSARISRPAKSTPYRRLRSASWQPEVPAGGEDPVSSAGDDRHAELRIIAERDERLTHEPRGDVVDRVGLRAVEGEGDDMAFAVAPEDICHAMILQGRQHRPHMLGERAHHGRLPLAGDRQRDPQIRQPRQAALGGQDPKVVRYGRSRQHR